MIDSVSRNQCCGCEACVQACPAMCITMHEDDEGFLFPNIDRQRCLHCNKCSMVCPVVRKTSSRWPSACYAYRAKDEELLKRTSSGGFFTAAAIKVLENQGVVFGAAINERNEVIHGFIQSFTDIDVLRRSKYVQSRIGSSFIDCKEFLERGRDVLFCGTPCQIKALRAFLGRGYKNLITLDFVCHGVPSPGVFRTYLSELAARKSCRISDVRNINFRYKTQGFAYSFSYDGLGGTCVENPRENVFLKGFLADIFLRRSCYNCPAKCFTSKADYTMCDFWEVKRVLPEFVNGGVPGVNLVFVNEDPLRLFANLDNDCAASVVRLEGAIYKYMPVWALKSVPRTSRRKRFYQAVSHNISIYDAVNRYSDLTLYERIKMMPTRVVNAFLRRVGVK